MYRLTKNGNPFELTTTRNMLTRRPLDYVAAQRRPQKWYIVPQGFELLVFCPCGIPTSHSDIIAVLKVAINRDA